MPLYQLSCPSGHRFSRFISLALFDIDDWKHCDCGERAEIEIQPPLLVTAQPECHYTSPIDDRPITSWAQRREDLAKHNCEPYDPDRKTDYTNRLKREDEAIDKSIHAHVEEAVEKMPSAKRAKLASDLIDKGTGLEYTRGTPDA
jgi:hypothetical protein